MGWGLWKLDEAGRWGPGYAGDMQVCGTSWEGRRKVWGCGLGRFGSHPQESPYPEKYSNEGAGEVRGAVSFGVTVT